MENVSYVELTKSLEDAAVGFLLESDRYSLELCRRALKSTAWESANYLRFTLGHAYSSSRNCSIAAVDKSGNMIGIRQAYITTLEEIVERYKSAVKQSDLLWPSLKPLVTVQLQLLEESLAKELDDYRNRSIDFLDFILIRQEYFGSGLSTGLIDTSIKLALKGAEKGRRSAFLWFSNSSRGNQDSPDIIMTQKYADVLLDGTNPFVSIAHEKLQLRGIILLDEDLAFLISKL